MKEFENAKWICCPAEGADAGEGVLTGRLASGEVVATVCNPPDRNGLVPLFRRSFRLTEKPTEAILSVTAAGLYRLFVNGVNVNYSLFDPGWTDYPKRLQYQSYRIEGLLKDNNTLELLAAGGWAYAGLLGAGTHFFSDRVAVLAGLTLRYADGREERIGSDESWEVFRSRIRFSHIYQGEDIDLGAEPEYLGHAVETELDAKLIPQEKEPVTEREILPLRREFVTPEGDRVLDFGQNLAGRVCLTVKGRKGARIIVRHAETLDEKGNFYVKNLRTAAQKMEYVLGKDGVSELKPVFTVQGFRYAAVDVDEGVEILKAEAIAVYTGMKRTGVISCGNEKIERLCDAVLWNLRSNFLEVPTDCPQRDERLGWLGDAEVFAPSAAFLYDVKNFYCCWLRDVASGQREDGGIPAIAPYNRAGYPFRVSAAWADAITVVPHVLHENYGDRSVLEEFYPSMLRYVDYLKTAGPVEELWLGGNHYGDWLALDGPDPRNPKTNKDMIASAYYYHSLELTVCAGKILGKDTAELEALLVRVRKAFRERFLGMRDSYAALSLLLCFGLLEENEKAEAARELADMVERNGNRLLAGVVGAPIVLQALSENGYANKAYDLLLEEGVPSWLGMLRYGATTLWERLDTFDENGMKDIRNASLNHYMFGSVLQWLVEGAGGLKTEAPGWSSFVWKPLPEKRLGSLRIRKDCPSGRIEAGWSVTDGGVRYALTVPDGAKARILLPGKEAFFRGPGSYEF